MISFSPFLLGFACPFRYGTSRNGVDRYGHVSRFIQQVVQVDLTLLFSLDKKYMTMICNTYRHLGGEEP